MVKVSEAFGRFFFSFHFLVDAFTGRVYVYSLNVYNVWVLSATIQSPLGTFDSFGYTLDLSGTTAVIGSASDRGKLLIFYLISFPKCLSFILSFYL
jgi:hypothetical protein